FMATFVGFVPVSKPRFAIIVAIDEPRGLHQGGQVAAPIFNHIAEAALGDYGVLPETEEHQQAIARLGEIYRSKMSEQGKQIAENLPLDNAASEKDSAKKDQQNKGQSSTVANAKPTSSQDKPRRNEVAVNNAQNNRSENKKSESSDVMPDLRGHSIRDVIGAVGRLKLKLKANGNGLVVKQSPAPGARIKPGEVCAVEFR
ncbi:MAG TPA: PASTA domain-containing protein, partial [Blastocatellia bacterium]|nr:PASTA domain-containing protein [Blastocatellia bacterium]